MMKIPDKRRAISTIGNIKNNLFKEKYRSFESPYAIPDFNPHITAPENRNIFVKRNEEIGDMFEWGLK